MKRPITLLLSAIIGTGYAIYIISYFAGVTTAQTETTEQVGAVIATALATPHMVLVVLAVIFNWLGWLMRFSGFALTGAILYIVGGVLFLLYIPFTIPSMILSFIGYARMKKLKKA